MPGQLYLRNLFCTTKESNLIQHSTRNTTPYYPSHALSPSIFEPTREPPPFLPPQQLVNPQLSVILSSIKASRATYLPFPNIPQQNIVHSHQGRLVPCPTVPKRPLNRNPDLNLWRFSQNTPQKQTR